MATLKELHDELGKLLAQGVDPELTVHDGDYYAVERAEVCVAEVAEFPESWNMPEGTEYIKFSRV